jgi:polyhydroxyalkanoate synthesis regulator protein
MAMFEQALSMWTPFSGGMPGGPREEGAGETNKKSAAPSAKGETDDIRDLKAQLANMQQKIDKLSKGND